MKYRLKSLRMIGFSDLILQAKKKSTEINKKKHYVVVLDVIDWKLETKQS